MNIVDLSKILEEKYVNLKEVENISLFKNVDILNISESIFGIESLL